MPAPSLLAVLPELVAAAGVGDNGVVAALVEDVLAVGVLGGFSEGEHVRFAKEILADVHLDEGEGETYLMVLISTGMPYSQTLSDRSSDVDMNRRFSSMYSMVLIGPR